MSKDEKVIAEWPEHLTNEGQKLDPLPEGEQTDYVLFRFQGADTTKYANIVKQAAIDVVEQHGDVVGVAFITATQKRNRFLPKNAWPMIRGLFDYCMNWTQERTDKR